MRPLLEDQRGDARVRLRPRGAQRVEPALQWGWANNNDARDVELR